MDSQEMLKLVNAYPIILPLLWVALGGLLGAIPFIFAYAKNLGRRKELATELAEAKDAIQKARDAYDKEREKTDALNREIKHLREVVHYHGYSFVKSDPVPHHPLCPSCLADEIRTRMIVGVGQNNVFALKCPITKCQIELKATKSVVDDLLNCDLTVLPSV